ncbi:hypothetical protein CHS0354_038829 [Potamilus streckersoni]|uniref:Ig-like domain-containing protein n=1 Tax=Potamilus streckersoni TaxID=2493646 RepID=A0AAE0TGX1_9BIVA|nr:hypothetical protein CHS0354_038829 [Potamilus streckersoni]
MCGKIFFSNLLCISTLLILLDQVFGIEPSFDVPIINVTVHEGDTAVLPCSVDYLAEHKVVWTDQWSTLLTLDDRRIIDDTRISIERPYTKDWNLHIRKVEYKDRGPYTCQINTNPVKTKSVMLNVLVPSLIINGMSSRDTTAREGDTVTLICNVTGVPLPEVTWYKLPMDRTISKERLDTETGAFTHLDSCIYSLKPKDVYQMDPSGRNVIGHIESDGIGTAGEILMIHNVSRYCDGTYECVAYNEVGPAVTRQMNVLVEYPPEITLPTRRIGQYPGRETILDCEITAYPHGVMYWMKDGMDLDFMNEEKYRIELYSGNDDSKRKTLSLRVKDITKNDYGEYTCFAKNFLGQDQESMILYDYSIHDVKVDTTTSTVRRIFHTVTKSNAIPSLQGTELKPSVVVNRLPYPEGNKIQGKDISVIQSPPEKHKSPGLQCSGVHVPVCADKPYRNTNAITSIHSQKTLISLLGNILFFALKTLS